VPGPGPSSVPIADAVIAWSPGDHADVDARILSGAHGVDRLRTQRVDDADRSFVGRAGLEPATNGF
jgi:hypothetical protein